MKTALDRSGRSYRYVPNDPFDTRIYTLKNGLTVFLSRNTAKPRVAVMTIVRAGSTDEPERSTGLAHYFEHMMFKGTSRMGTLDWKKEKALIDRISDLFEQRKNESDPKKKAALYKEIDKLSGEAAKYAAAGEFSNLASSIGTAGLNAATGLDFTVYLGDVPSNELGKYLKLDAERFSRPVLRLFHTELEAVYEEFNRGQDKDHIVAYEHLNRAILPKHPAGRSVIGYPEHLKNPSMKDIMRFFDQYYVPGNMAVALVGDIDFEQACKMVDDTFGKFPAAPLPTRSLPVEKPLEKNLKMSVSGPDAEMLWIGFRIDRNPRNAALLTLVTRLLVDSGYGILEQNLGRSQKVLSAGAYPRTGREYSLLLLNGQPRAGQSLDQVANLLLKEIDKLRKGDYEDWRIKAVAENSRVTIAEVRESENMNLCWEFAELFVNRDDYAELLETPDRIEKFTKKDVSDFINAYCKHYVRVDKKTGKADHRVKVAKPKITPISLNSKQESEFSRAFRKLPAAPVLPPPVVNIAEDISVRELPNGITVKRMNKFNSTELFRAERVIDVTKYSNLKIDLALGYLSFIGTDRYSTDALRQEFYKLGVKFDFSIDKYQLTASITGPAANLDKAVMLLEHFVRHAKPDQQAYRKYVDGILKDRSDDKLNPSQIFFRTVVYSWYGKLNPYTDLLSEKSLRETKPEELTNLVRTLFTDYRSTFAYAGPATLDQVVKTASKIESKGTVAPPAWSYKFKPLAVEKPKVFLVPTDSVQIRVGFTSRGPLFSLGKLPCGDVFNDYFCQGLDSIVFQEIRESRALAYSAGGNYEQSMNKGRHNVIYMLAGTQGDKLFDVIGTMSGLLKNLPQYEGKFTSSKVSVLKKLATDRVTGLDLINFEKKMKRIGTTHDWRQKEFETIQKMTLPELAAFFNGNLAPLKYNILVVGKISAADRRKLAGYGEIVDLNLQEIFGY